MNRAYGNNYRWGKITWQQRFEASISPEPNSGCWLWTGCYSSNGYGQICVDGRGMNTHRASWIYHNGPIPNGMCVRHHCDNRACVNPAHLCLGTLNDNNQDKVARGNGAGERNSGVKLSFAKVREIRASNEMQSVLARKYGVHQSLISRIKRYENWRVER